MEESNNNLPQHYSPSSNPQTSGVLSMIYIVARAPDQHDDDGDYDDEDDVEHENTMPDFDLNVEPAHQEDELEDDQLGFRENSISDFDMDFSWEENEVQQENMVLDFDLNLPPPVNDVQEQQENMAPRSGLELPLEEEPENEQENMVLENVQWPSREDEDQRENHQPRNQFQESNLSIYIIYYNRFRQQVDSGRDHLDSNAGGNHGGFPWESVNDLIAALQQFFQGINQSRNLSEETISEHLKTKKYQSPANQDCQEEHEICIVCQCEYENQETVATLDCGHEYHADCIKKWFLKKNLCPICKRTEF
ncbi:E3 ubiquitin ligase BIG BROTHER-related-like [Coffea eugenioides]|uniref:E3 ubiquitin ligase BIG BROTHER-related-like n=1 Tax=Coffea eugenioides TaxID=49369 RepID=UPI000F60CE17|nr:E3 ubiquitin ligase BIG BROTHER-related-like [Coffea eugenioides]